LAGWKIRDKSYEKSNGDIARNAEPCVDEPRFSGYQSSFFEPIPLKIMPFSGKYYLSFKKCIFLE